MLRRVRLATGLILFAYVTTHFANHATGLVSLSAMEEARAYFDAVWRTIPGTIALFGSLVVHLLLAVWSLYERRSLRMRWGEALQIVLGFSIPLLLAVHFIGTRGAHEIYGVRSTYPYILLVQWKFSPQFIYWQTAGLLAAWIHGCIGLYYWLRLKPWFARAVPLLYAAAILVPVVSLLGFAAAGREAVALAESRDWLAEVLARANPPDQAGVDALYRAAEALQYLVVGLIGVALAGRAVRSVVETRRGFITVTYPEGRTARIAPGLSILDASRLNGIPHASVCGGRGRCSTCRVRVVSGDEFMPPPRADEKRVLERVGAPPRVRLACQSVPTGDVSVMPLLAPTASVDDARHGAGVAGQERDLVILFADLRSFTQFSEKKLPYDVVFVLNRYFANMGEAVEQSGGHVDKFIGDGVMALFGAETDIVTACNQALAAARAMAERLADLNTQLSEDLDEPLRIGIGLHAGPAIIGEMGYGLATGLTAVGDSVNTASRLEAMTKEFGAQLVFSDTVARRATLDLSGFPVREITIRGRDEAIRVHVVADATAL